MQLINVMGLQNFLLVWKSSHPKEDWNVTHKQGLKRVKVRMKTERIVERTKDERDSGR